MQRRTYTWPRLAVALTIAVPLAICWAAIAMSLFSLVEDRFDPHGGRPHEALQISQDGTPLIETFARGRFNNVGDFRSLDGKRVSLPREELMNGTNLWAPGQQAPTPLPFGWQQRLAGISDSQRSGTDWYLVRPEDPLGPGYFVGFDESVFNHTRVGYIGTAGFRPAIPAPEEWFDLPRRPLTFADGIATSGGELVFTGRARNYYGNIANSSPQEKGARIWDVYLIDGDRLCQVDLRARTVKTLREGIGPASIARIFESPTRSRAPTENAAADDAAAKDAAPAVPNAPTVRSAFISLLALRSEDRIVIIDPSTDETREFPLPMDLRSKFLNAFLVPGESLLVTTGYEQFFDGAPLDVWWLPPEGPVTRRESVTLAPLLQPTSLQTSAVMAIVVPVPIAWLGSVGLPSTGPPFSSPDESYAESVVRVFAGIWPVLLGLATFGAFFAWWTYRLQRKYHRPATAAWCGFVFLFGPAGFLAYLIENRRAKLETCPQCKAKVPRDREACAACDAVFLPPLRLGTEIFA